MNRQQCPALPLCCIMASVQARMPSCMYHDQPIHVHGITLPCTLPVLQPASNIAQANLGSMLTLKLVPVSCHLVPCLQDKCGIACLPVQHLPCSSNLDEAGVCRQVRTRCMQWRHLVWLSMLHSLWLLQVQPVHLAITSCVCCLPTHSSCSMFIEPH